MYDKNCQLCTLSKNRTQIVWGSGSKNAQIMFIGEAPGRKEDEGGLPFIGAAGKILDEFLARAQLNRNDIYITNIVKCRPPNNRNPKPDEIYACAKYLLHQIETIQPRVIITLGSFATQAILGTDTPISQLHNKPQQYGNYTVLPLYHPAATIYNQQLRPQFINSANTLRDLIK